MTGDLQLTVTTQVYAVHTVAKGNTSPLQPAVGCMDNIAQGKQGCQAFGKNLTGKAVPPWPWRARRGAVPPGSWAQGRRWTECDAGWWWPVAGRPQLLRWRLSGAGLGVPAPTEVGKTGGSAFLPLSECVPPPPMRAAALSHLLPVAGCVCRAAGGRGRAVLLRRPLAALRLLVSAVGLTIRRSSAAFRLLAPPPFRACAGLCARWRLPLASGRIRCRWPRLP